MLTLVAVDPTTQAQGLLIEIHPELERANEPLLAALCRRLYDESVRVGLLVARRETIVVRDMVSDLEFARSRFETKTVETADLFESAQLGAPSVGDRFVAQVEQWLIAVATSWHSTLSRAAIAAMVPDVVGHLVGAAVHPRDDDAAAAE
jgi:hypothetical protein